MTWTCPNCGAVFDEEQTMKDHATMICQRVLDVHPDGGWHAPAFLNRQYESDDVTARTKKHRKATEATPMERSINGDRPHDGTPPETEADTESEVAAADAVTQETERRIAERRRRGHDIGPALEKLIRGDVERDLGLALTAAATPISSPPRWDPGCSECGGTTFVSDADLEVSLPCSQCRPSERANTEYELGRAKEPA